MNDPVNSKPGSTAGMKSHVARPPLIRKALPADKTLPTLSLKSLIDQQNARARRVQRPQDLSQRFMSASNSMALMNSYKVPKSKRASLGAEMAMGPKISPGKSYHSTTKIQNFALAQASSQISLSTRKQAIRTNHAKFASHVKKDDD